VASFTGNPSRDIFSVIKVPPFNIDVSFRLNVAGGAPPHRTRKAVLLPFGAGLEVMTNKTIGFMDRKMFALNKLGMARGATKFHAPPQLAQVLSVGKSNILVNHIFLQVFDFVATLLETTRITNLCMRFVWPLPRNEIGQRNLTINPFPSQVAEESGFIVAFGAGHIAMARCFPGLNIARHLMAGTAESRSL